MMSKKVYNILYLDDLRYAIAFLPGRQLEDDESQLWKCDEIGKNVFLRIIPEGLIYQSHDFYRSSKQLEDWIEVETNTGKYHYVVIGNFNGAGFLKAAFVNPEMRADKACIVWNNYPPFEDSINQMKYEDKINRGLNVSPPDPAMAKYHQLGYRHFLGRLDLSKHLVEYFRNL